MARNSSEQIAFDLRAPAPKTFATFFQSGSNEDAVSWLRSPEKWSMPIFALIGPSGSGKSHLAGAFTQLHKGRVLRADMPVPISECRGRVIALDNAQMWSEESLFILLNMALNGDVPYLLLTDSHTPSLWDVKLPDLRSRLKNIPVTNLKLPDEALLEPIIKQIFSDYGREIDKNVIDYMLIHCSRDINDIRKDIENIERTARAANKDVTKRFVAKVLKAP